ncbi:COPII coat assembly protein sec16 [Erysiphe necator]|nr:COPII coat assembly protein sec16 [Erysiphe necator]
MFNTFHKSALPFLKCHVIENRKSFTDQDLLGKYKWNYFSVGTFSQYLFTADSYYECTKNSNHFCALRASARLRMTSEISYTPWNPALMPNASKTALTSEYTSTPTSLLHFDLEQKDEKQLQNSATNRLETFKETTIQDTITRKTVKDKTERNELSLPLNSDLSLTTCHDADSETGSKGEENLRTIATENLRTELKAQCMGKKNSQNDEIDYDWNLQPTENESPESRMKSDQANLLPQVLSQFSTENKSQLIQLDKQLNEQEQESNDNYKKDSVDSAIILPRRASIINGQSDSNIPEYSIISKKDELNEQNSSDYSQEGKISNENFQVLERLATPTLEQKPSLDSTQSNYYENMQSEDNSGYFHQSSRIFDEFEKIKNSASELNSHVLQSLVLETEEHAQDFFHDSQKNTVEICHSNQISKCAASSVSIKTSPASKDIDISPTQCTVSFESKNIVSSEEDLAAKWREALSSDINSDELLEDDDDLLLDDDEHNQTVQQKEIDPSTLFGSDDEGFLENEENNPFDVSKQENKKSILSPAADISLQEISRGSHTNSQIRSTSAIFMPTDLSTINSDSKNYSSSSVPPFNEQLNYSSAQILASSTSSRPSFNISSPQNNQRLDNSITKSFANMSKGGYSSPYDLPIDVVPKKRMSVQLPNRSTPPGSYKAFNSNSIPSNPIMPPSSSTNLKPAQVVLSNSKNSANIVKNSQSSFFEDLPISSKPKAITRRSSSYNSTSKNQIPDVSTGTSQPATLTTGSKISPPFQQLPAQPVVELNPSQGPIISERLGTYASSSTAYIPAALASQDQNLIQNPSQPPYPPVSHIGTRQYTPHNNNSHSVSASMRMHYPRTSSPLAQFNNSQNDYAMGINSRSINADYQKSSLGIDSSMHSLSPTREVDESDQSLSNWNPAYGQTALPSQGITQSHPNTFSARNTLSRTISSPSKYSLNSTFEKSVDVNPLSFEPPQRPRTQSPKSMLINSTSKKMNSHQHHRSASFEPPVLKPNLAIGYSPIENSTISQISGSLHQQTNFITPTDGRELDPLQRWKGSPIFAWGVGGIIVSSFPKSIPQFRSNESSQAILRYPGEIRIGNIKEQCPLNPLIAQFPGPLRGKSKKKEIIAWLTTGIELLESDTDKYQMSPHLSHDQKCLEERVVLWKILRIFIEYDGNLEGPSNVLQAVKEIISSEPQNTKSQEVPLYTTGAELIDSTESRAATSQTEAIDPATVEKLKNYLSQGERVKAVWEAVDKRLWAHAILISNTVSQDLYKQVAQEFVQKEVRIIDNNSQPLAFLYEIFAGNFEESIDELVPPSARAGFQLVSTSNNAESLQDTLTSLDKWRESLNLVLCNRNAEDTRALIALGNLLAGYGRVEAAHVCFIFARHLAVFNGVDDPLAKFVLIGSDHLRLPYDFDRELKSILISEVFDYGQSLSNQSTAAVSSPHLAVYKLHYAKVLAEYGFREKALNYCEIITASTTSQTRRLPYHHDLLISEVEDLFRRLKRSPRSASSSWISKPSIDKAKGSVWATFNKFVAGEESDAAESMPDLSIATDVNSFSKTVGGTPVISISPSNIELTNQYTNAFDIMNSNNSLPVTVTSSRYAPSSNYQTQIQDPYLTKSQGPQDTRLAGGNSPSEYSPYEPQQPNPSKNESEFFKSQQMNTANVNLHQKVHHYTAQPSIHYGTNTPKYQEASSFHQSPSLDSSHLGSELPQGQKAADNFHEPIKSSPHYSSQNEPSSHYEAPLSNSYEPLSVEYEPLLAVNNDDYGSHKNLAGPESNTDEKFKDTQNIENSISKEKTRAEKDREADKAFRLAAEADAQKLKESNQTKKGWGIASWFGGGAKKSHEEVPLNKPIRAKLGEASSFVYDPELKRWVNKKAGPEQVGKNSSTPPPPKSTGPPRLVNTPSNSRRPSVTTTSTSSVRPPMNMRNSSEQVISATKKHSVNDTITVASSEAPLLPPLPQGLTRTSSSNSVLPPSRPGTSMSNASSIDDLLGPPSVNKRSGIKTKKKGRGYIDVMSESTAS